MADIEMKAYFVESTNMAVVFRSRYGKSYAQVNDLVERLKTDYPGLTDEDINIDFFGGTRYSGVIHAYARVPECLEGYHSVEDRNYFL